MKIKISRNKLRLLIGEQPLNELETLFEDRYDEIIIRRCQPHGKFINFHTDVSLKTLQLALNGPDEYLGGQLVYLSNGSIHVPDRQSGTVTIHNNEIVHGVSVMMSGVRYGLFLLKKR